MRFLFDENADRRLAPYLQNLGHDVTIVGEDYPVSMKDDKVLTIAHHEKRILITNDRSDFGELIFRHHQPHYGIILFRFKLQETNITLKKQRLTHVLSAYTHQLHHFLVVTPERVKVRAMEETTEAA